MTSPGVPLLAIDRLNVSFARDARSQTAVRVVKDLSLTLAAGEKFALVGESGSGKTVTAQSILRLLPAEISGEIRFAGENLLALGESRLRGMRGKDIAMIFQEPTSALNPLMRVGDQIAEVIELHEGKPYVEARRRAIDLLVRTGIPEAERRFASYPHELSGGQCQRAMIAMALACRPKLLIADEPTTALDVTIRVQIMALLDELQREQGMAVLLITHDLNLVRRFAGRVGVMQAGCLVEVAETQTLFATPQHEYTRRLLDSQPRPLLHPPQENTAPPLLVGKEVRVEFSYPIGWFRRKTFTAVAEATLAVFPGETLGVVGESGSGKTTLAMALLGLQATTRGSCVFSGQSLQTLPSATLRALRARMQVVFQDPFSSLSPRMTIEQIVGEGIALHWPQLSPAKRQERIVATLREVGIDESALDRYPHEFSGGQRQRIAIARALVLHPELIVLDEPTSALDASVQKQVLELLTALQKKYGMSYLLISHDLSVIASMAHRIVVMREGRIVEHGPTASVMAAPADAYTRQLLAACL